MTVDDYLRGFDGGARATLDGLRALMRAAAPDAAEVIKWSHPTYETGAILFAFAGFARHANVYCTPSTIGAFASRAPYGSGKSSLKCPYDKPLPAQLLEEMLAYRVREYEQDGIGWM